MISSWGHNPRMTGTTAGMQGPLYTMGMSQSKQLLGGGGGVDCTKQQNKQPPSKRFSTMSFGFMSTVLQKITNMLMPSEMQINTLEKNKQSLSAPDIFVDISINTPIFEATQGLTKLTIPEDKEAICDQTKSLSVGNSPFDWCPIKELDSRRNMNEDCPNNPKKRMKVLVNNETPDSVQDKETCLKTRKAFNPMHMSHKLKTSCKNRKEKNRHNLFVDMMEDFHRISDESAAESDVENSEPNGYELTQNVICLVPTASLNIAVPLNLSEESFPTICPSVPEVLRASSRRGKRLSQPSECDSEDSFVIFSEEVQLTTPSASPARRKNFCAAINSFFIPPASLRRQRQTSDSSSDDSIVFCYDSDQQEADSHIDEDSDEGEMDDSDDDADDNTCDEESDDTLAQQPDSGFEDKKVRFNLKTEVHVMRMWDFAYRQARKGEWEMAARDRERFRKRIEETEKILKPVFERDLREKLYYERFNS